MAVVAPPVYVTNKVYVNRPSWAFVALVSVGLTAFVFVTLFLSGWPSPTCFDCHDPEGSPVLLVITSACGRSDLRHAWATHIAEQPASFSLAVIFILFLEDGKLCDAEVALDVAAGLHISVIHTIGRSRGDGMSGLVPGDAAELWKTAWNYVSDPSVQPVFSTASAAGWWLRTRDDVAIDTLALASYIGKLHESSSFDRVLPSTEPSSRSVLLGDFLSSHCQHLSVPHKQSWRLLTGDTELANLGSSSHLTLNSVLYILSSTAVRFIATDESVGLVKARVADESSYIIAAVLKQAASSHVPESLPPVVFHGRLVAASAQDLVWWSTTWERPVGLATNSGLMMMVPREINLARRVVAASCALAHTARSVDDSSGDTMMKEAVAGLKDVSSSLKKLGCLIGRCCEVPKSLKVGAPRRASHSDLAGVLLESELSVVF